MGIIAETVFDEVRVFKKIAGRAFHFGTRDRFVKTALSS
jgi:hypothetical protein